MQNATQVKEDLIMRAANLSKAAPDQWKQFLKALAAHNEVCRDQLASSPAPEIQNYQGRAQLMAALLDIFEDCQAVADRINAGKAKK